MPCVCILLRGEVFVMALDVMLFVCIMWRGGVSCPVSVYCGGVGCHVLCLYTVTWWGVMSCVCIL